MTATKYSMLGVIVFVILLTFFGALTFVSYAGAVRLRDDQVMYNTLQGVVRGLDKPYDDVAAARAAVVAVPSATATVLLVDAATYEPWACNSEPERALTFHKPPGRALEGGRLGYVPEGRKSKPGETGRARAVGRGVPCGVRITG